MHSTAQFVCVLYVSFPSVDGCDVWISLVCLECSCVKSQRRLVAKDSESHRAVHNGEYSVFSECK